MSRVAWFRAAPPDATAPLDETSPIISALRARHRIDVVTEGSAHDFVWQHFRTPYDACVYELGNTPAHRFLRAYLPHYPGIVAPRGLGCDAIAAQPVERTADAPLTLGVLDATRIDVLERAAARAALAGAAVRIVHGLHGAALHEADVLVALEWPPLPGVPTAAILGMAAAKPVIVLEVEATAAWPAFDPQSWRTRGFGDDTPIVVSLDPRDEEHSLMRAIVRLAADASLRMALGAAAQAWWRDNATLAHAVRAWETMLAKAAAAGKRPVHARDGSERARAILTDLGVPVDFLPTRNPAPS
jgi:hypothetical protein